MQSMRPSIWPTIDVWRAPDTNCKSKCPAQMSRAANSIRILPMPMDTNDWWATAADAIAMVGHYVWWHRSQTPVRIRRNRIDEDICECHWKINFSVSGRRWWWRLSSIHLMKNIRPVILFLMFKLSDSLVRCTPNMRVINEANSSVDEFRSGHAGAL